MKKFIRGLVIGEQRYFDSWTEYRQVMLAGQFGLIALIAFTLLLIIDILRGDFTTLPVYIVGAVCVVMAIRFHRVGLHCRANTLLYLSLITIVYLFISSESPSNGGFVFFIPIALGAFASFDYKHRKLAMMVAGYAAFMFLAGTFCDFHVLPWRDYTTQVVELNRLIYFVLAMPASVIAIYSIMRLNHHNAKQLLESNKLLKKSNEELDRFVYSTSHDLRAPLNSLLGLINISESTNKIDELRKYMNLMRNRVDALDKFICDITDYSRNSRTELALTTINLREFATDIWESLRHNLRAESIHFLIDCPENFNIETDPLRLRVILSNLISNSIRYHDCGKDYRYIRLNCKRTDKSFVLSVEDNGQGISPEYHNKIFQMFFRANNSSQGSGLGLYIVQETIQKLSGQLHLHSALSQGSKFTISLPVNR